jgi:hypothetical protein
MRELRYSIIILDVGSRWNNQLHAPAALTPEIELLVSIE